jgi:hypothetical protein
MKFVFTNHAQYRINERGISISKIKETIARPDKKSTQHNLIIVRKFFGRKILEVVYKVKINSYVIITAYYEN